MSIRKFLQQKESDSTPIKVCVIGCGRFGGMIIYQIQHIPGMEVSVICDLNVKKAISVASQAGISESNLKINNSVDKINTSISKNEVSIVDDAKLAVSSEVDVVVEATGNPLSGANNAIDAIRNGKHVTMVTVETDVLVGPELNKLASENDVVYSLAYGDQPALIEEMYDWAKSLGFNVIAAGKGTKYLDSYRFETPDNAYQRYGYTQEGFEKADLNPKMYNSFLDGTKSAIEMCAVSNMTGLIPDVPGMHFPPATITDLPNLLIPEYDGGLLKHDGGVVEVISCLNSDGSEIKNSLRWGVFVVISIDNLYILECMDDYGVIMNPSKKYAAIYRPYHFVGMETPITISKSVLFHEATGFSETRVADVAAVAKKNLSHGSVLDGEGGYTTYGSLYKAEDFDKNRLVPIGLVDKIKLTRDVNKNMPITLDDIELTESNILFNLRKNKFGE